MFETIQTVQSNGGGAPQWMSSHPDPGNRTQYINQEASHLTVAAAPDVSGFQSIKGMLASLPPAKSMGDLARAKGPSSEGGDTASVGTPGQPVPTPSSEYRTLNGGNVFQASVPSNWKALASKSSIKVVPENGYGQLNGQTVFSHGIEFGVTTAGSRDLQEATRALLNGVAQNNPDLRVAGDQQAVRIRSGRRLPLRS